MLGVSATSRHCEWLECPNRSRVDLTFQKCGRCKKVFYCGIDCQRADWSLHKIACIPPNASLTDLSQHWNQELDNARKNTQETSERLGQFREDHKGKMSVSTTSKLRHLSQSMEHAQETLATLGSSVDRLKILAQLETQFKKVDTQVKNQIRQLVESLKQNSTSDSASLAKKVILLQKMQAWETRVVTISKESIAADQAISSLDPAPPEQFSTWVKTKEKNINQMRTLLQEIVPYSVPS